MSENIDKRDIVKLADRIVNDSHEPSRDEIVAVAQALIDERFSAAAHAIDRADQMADGSCCWIGMADIAVDIASGRHAELFEAGEFTDLQKRVGGFAKRGRR